MNETYRKIFEPDSKLINKIVTQYQKPGNTKEIREIVRNELIRNGLINIQEELEDGEISPEDKDNLYRELRRISRDRVEIHDTKANEFEIFEEHLVDEIVKIIEARIEEALESREDDSEVKPGDYIRGPRARMGLEQDGYYNPYKAPKRERARPVRIWELRKEGQQKLEGLVTPRNDAARTETERKALNIFGEKLSDAVFNRRSGFQVQRLVSEMDRFSLRRSTEVIQNLHPDFEFTLRPQTLGHEQIKRIDTLLANGLKTSNVTIEGDLGAPGTYRILNSEKQQIGAINLLAHNPSKQEGQKKSKFVLLISINNEEKHEVAKAWKTSLKLTSEMEGQKKDNLVKVCKKVAEGSVEEKHQRAQQKLRDLFAIPKKLRGGQLSKLLIRLICENQDITDLLGDVFDYFASQITKKKKIQEKKEAKAPTSIQNEQANNYKGKPVQTRTRNHHKNSKGKPDSRNPAQVISANQKAARKRRKLIARNSKLASSDAAQKRSQNEDDEKKDNENEEKKKF